MLWDIIRDFFVQFVFGGTTSNGDDYKGLVGNFWSNGAGDYTQEATNTFYLPINGMGGNSGSDLSLDAISMGDWLSTTATIIVLVWLSIMAFAFVTWLTKRIAYAFMLKD